MAQILVRNLDPEVVKQLKERATRAGRSLQAECRLILEEAAPEMDLETARKRLEAFRKRLGNRKFTDSVELIREDRDR